MSKYFNADFEKSEIKKELSSIQHIYRINTRSSVKVWIIGIFVVASIILVLPWTQNIRAKGKVTTLKQEQRPQELNTIIAGTVEKWYVKEGDIVEKGDTILQLGEVKVDYFDPELLKRTESQIESKKTSVQGYKNKAATANTQVSALEQALDLKIQSISNKIGQQVLKVNSDEQDLIASQNELNAYNRQLSAANQMYENGAISLSELEKRRINYQNAVAKNNSASNKLLQSKQELANLKLEQQAINQDYIEKIAKAEGDKFTSLSSAANAEAEISKLENLYSNYDARNKLYYVIAPQGGQITKAKKAGIGEFVKEGEMIVEIVPKNIQYAVELYINPMDLPLVKKGQKVQFIFDGYPAIVFSGWPKSNYGTFRGVVFAIEKTISENGKFRVLVTEDSADRKWPEHLSIGTGADGIMLLKDVRVYYELWRNINGFPPNYYE
jgi:multidrug efflux pump subunit AcrA (membrane-fusion protein)